MSAKNQVIVHRRRPIPGPWSIRVVLAVAVAGCWARVQAGAVPPGDSAWDWSRSQPEVEWRAEVGAGFAGLAVEGDLVFAFGNEGDEDRVTALETDSGRPRWIYRFPSRALGIAKPDERGPRSTPAVAGDHVYILSRDGRLLCLSRAEGALRWWMDIPAELGERPPYWGFSGSPLIWKDTLIWNVGERGLALRADTGAIVWKSAPRPSEVWKNEPVGVSGYTSPTIVEFGGRPLVALANETRWLLADPDSGEERWSAAWETPYGVNAAQPAVVDGQVVLSGGYGYGIRRVALGGNGVPVWTNLNLRSHFAPLVTRGGFIYGIDGNQQDGSKCELRCLDLATGAIRWTRPQFGFANLTLIGNRLLLLTARGELVVAAADPAGYRESGRVQVVGGESWTAPRLIGRGVYLRNKLGTAAKVRLPGAP